MKGIFIRGLGKIAEENKVFPILERPVLKILDLILKLLYGICIWYKGYFFLEKTIFIQQTINKLIPCEYKIASTDRSLFFFIQNIFVIWWGHRAILRNENARYEALIGCFSPFL